MTQAIDTPAIDVAIAEHVFRWQRMPPHAATHFIWWDTDSNEGVVPTPAFSTAWRQAMRIPEALRGGPGALFSTRNRFTTFLQEEVSRATFVNDIIPVNAAKAGSLIHPLWMIFYLTPIAICRAALRAVGAEVPE